MRKAIVTIATGIHLRLWENFAQPFWSQFCLKNGYDLFCFKGPIDKSPKASSRSIAWQKLIVHRESKLKDYDLLIWLDADIIINPEAPDPATKLKGNKIGACLEFDWGNDPQTKHLNLACKNHHKAVLKEQGINFESYQKLWGFDPSSGPLINTGFLIYLKNEHAEILDYVYEKFDDTNVPHWGEMVPLSETMHQKNIFQRFDDRYNLLPMIYMSSLLSGDFWEKPKETGAISIIYRLLNDGYFIHFAGCKSWAMNLLAGATYSREEGFRTKEID